MAIDHGCPVCRVVRRGDPLTSSGSAVTSQGKSMKAVAGFEAGFRYGAYHLLQSPRALFVAGRYDLAEYLD